MALWQSNHSVHTKKHTGSLYRLPAVACIITTCMHKCNIQQQTIPMDFQLKMKRGSKEESPLKIQCIFQVMRKTPATVCIGMYANGAQQPCCKEMRNQRHNIYASYFLAYTTVA